MFVRVGASFRDSMFVENFVLALAMVGLLHYWTLVMTRDRIAALISPLLVLFNGGLGWLKVFNESRENEKGILSVLMHPEHSYTVIPETTWRWGNSLTSLFITQRSILMGLPLALIVFTQWWKAGGDARAGELKTEPDENGRGNVEKGNLGKGG